MERSGQQCQCPPLTCGPGHRLPFTAPGTQATAAARQIGLELTTLQREGFLSMETPAHTPPGDQWGWWAGLLFPAKVLWVRPGIKADLGLGLVRDPQPWGETLTLTVLGADEARMEVLISRKLRSNPSPSGP
jgi:hypothetical protein